jgi:hypothetical protein
MKFIITEEQQNSLKTKLQKMVKKLGWKKTAKAVASPKNLAKLAFNKDPLEFINMFNNLDVVRSEEQPDWTLFRYEKGNNIMIYDKKDEIVYINFDVIWSFLEDGFGLNYEEIQGITKEWLVETYNLKGVTTTNSVLIFREWLGETYNLT